MRSTLTRGFYGVDLIFVRRYDEAIEQFERALATSPDLPFALHSLAVALWLTGRLEECVQVQRRAALAVREPEVEQALADGYREGGFAMAMRRAAEAEIAHSARAQIKPLWVALYWLRAGETEAALEWLEKGFEAHDPAMPYLRLPGWDAVRDHPRFQSLFEKMKL